MKSRKDRPDQFAFVDMMKGPAEKAEARFYIPWQVTIAQSALETGWGRSPIKDPKTGANTFNYWGRKWFPWMQGTYDYVAITTHEVIDGKRKELVDRFVKYKSLEEAVGHRAQLLMQDKRYKPVWKYVKDPKRFATELAKAGWATDPEYAGKLLSIMKDYMGVE